MKSKNFRKKSEISLTGNHLVNIIIGLIALLLLFFGFYMFYLFLASDSTDIKNAGKNLDYIKNQMDNSFKAPGEELLVDVTGPGNDWWWIIAWPYGNTIEKPAACNLEYKSWCICICERPSNMRKAWNFISFQGGFLTSMLQSCNNNGVCRSSNYPVKTFYQESNTPIPIENPPIEIKVKYIDTNQGYEITFIK
jgi:hypothetical protein